MYKYTASSYDLKSEHVATSSYWYFAQNSEHYLQLASLNCSNLLQVFFFIQIKYKYFTYSQISRKLRANMFQFFAYIYSITIALRI